MNLGKHSHQQQYHKECRRDLEREKQHSYYDKDGVLKNNIK